jgi:phosphatidylinositol-3-phosphatase
MKSWCASILKSTALSLVGLSVALSANAVESNVPKSKFGRFDHVFLIIMENQLDTFILGNANAPFINAYAQTVNQATNYFAVGHPSAPNYLEIVGGSNFGLTGDYWPNWPTQGCVDNAPNSTSCNNPFTPISASGSDNPVVATATSSSQCNGEITISGTATPNNCALYNYASAYFTPKSIADQLVAKGLTWKTYQESLPTVAPGASGVNYSDGEFSNLSTSPFATTPPNTIQKLYAVKHNPFVYFQNVETGATSGLSLTQIQDFDGPSGLWADLQDPKNFPHFAFIVPNQCHDMHGSVSGGPAICSSNTETGAEGALLLAEGDAEVAKIVNGIKASPVWSKGRNAIIVTWDENDYSNAANQVVFLSETNYATNGVQSSTPYDHYSLLRTLEAGFGLPCLNHACDQTSLVMNELFGAP